MKSVYLVIVLLSLQVGAEGICIRDDPVNCGSELETRGALHVDCSGGDYIVTLGVEETMATLTIVAECSTSCSNERTLYYYDLSGKTTIDSTFNRTFNGSSNLGLPATSESTHCRLFGCYQLGDDNFLLNGSSCFPSDHSIVTPHTKVTTGIATTGIATTGIATTGIATTNDELQFTGFQYTEELTSSSSTDSTTAEYSSTTTESSEELVIADSSPHKKNLAVAMAIAVILFIIFTLAAVLIMTLCCTAVYRNKSYKKPFPHIEELYDTDPNDEFIVDINGKCLYPLSAATSQITVFNGLSNNDAITEKPSCTSFEREGSYSLISSSYFKMGGANSSLSLTEMGLVDKSDMSDTASTGDKSDVTFQVMLEEDQLLTDKSLQSETDPKKSNNAGEQFNIKAAHKRPQSLVYSEESEYMPNTLEITNEGLQMVENSCRKFSISNPETETVDDIRINLSIESGHATKEQSMSNCLPLVNALPSKVVAARNLATCGSDYLASNTSEGVRVLMEESDRELTYPLSTELGCADDASIHTNLSLFPGKGSTSLPCASDSASRANLEVVLASDSEMALASDYLPNSLSTPAIIHPASMASNGLTGIPTIDQDCSEECSKIRLHNNSPTFGRRWHYSVKNSSNYVSNTGHFVSEEDTAITSIAKEFAAEPRRSGNGSLAARLSSCSIDALCEGYVTTPPGTKEEQERHTSICSTHQTFSDQVSLSLEADKSTSDMTEDSEEENIDDYYTSNSDNESESDTSNNVGKPTEILSRRGIHSEGYIRRDLTVDSDSVQFYFPNRKPDLHKTHGLGKVVDNRESTSSSPDYSVQDVPGVCDCNFSFNYSTSSSPIEDQPASFSSSDLDISPLSAFTAPSDLKLSLHNSVDPLDIGYSRKKIHSLINTRMNVINYSFDREDERNSYINDSESDVNFSFT